MSVNSSFVRHFAIIAVVALFALPAALQALQYPGMADARIAEIAQMLPENPIGFGVPCSDRAAWQAVAHDYQGSVEKAEAFIAAPLPAWDIAKYQLYSQTGDRKIGEAMMRAQLPPAWPARSGRVQRMEKQVSAPHRGRARRNCLAGFVGRACAPVMPSTSMHPRSWARSGRGALSSRRSPARSHTQKLVRWAASSRTYLRRCANRLREFILTHRLHVHSNWNSVCLDGTVGAQRLRFFPDAMIARSLWLQPSIGPQLSLQL